MIVFHRKEQFDIVKGGIKKPLLVVGWKTPDSYSRLFCLWSGGVWLRLWGNVRLCWQWSKRQLTQRAADGAGTLFKNEDWLNEPICSKCGHSKSRHQTAGGFCKHCTCNEFVEPCAHIWHVNIFNDKYQVCDLCGAETPRR